MPKKIIKTIPKIVQISAANNSLYALDDEGRAWEYRGWEYYESASGREFWTPLSDLPEQTIEESK